MQTCVTCHKEVTAGIVKDWQMSKHSKSGNDVFCTVCHGDQHTSKADVAKAVTPTADTCQQCHEKQGAQFKAGKHALAWTAMKAMPTAHWQPMALMDGMKGCGGCHKLGIKTEAEIKKLKKQGIGFGLASCDVCHTRHLFSAKEAKQPQSCQTCHMGFDHPQWEMYSSSKHGVRFLLKQNGILPETTVAPTCQTCHMQDGNHEVRTAWGFLAVRLPMPEDKVWASARITILQALGVLDPNGKPTDRFAVIKKADLARLTQDEWKRERDKMLETCSQCHSLNFAQAELEKGDQIIREADLLMAEAIRIVAGLYGKGLLEKPKNYTYSFPDMLSFHDAPTPIEQRLFLMFMKHRMRMFQGAFHTNPDYAFWYGWSAMRQDLSEIKALAETLRSTHK
ncbi:MAG: multiheme c-type cytochrome [Thermodesulfobacteriota bacterium]|nr:multiheme c-type cytochrome [Thermodesulfobacteriota bacterium]